MDRKTIEDRVKEVMAGLFAMDPAAIGDETSLGTVEKWDSVNHLNLMMSLEQAFGVQIDMDDAVEMISFPAVCDTLARYVGEGS